MKAWGERGGYGGMPASREVASCSGTITASSVSPARASAPTNDRRSPRRDENRKELERWCLGSDAGAAGGRGSVPATGSIIAQNSPRREALNAAPSSAVRVGRPSGSATTEARRRCGWLWTTAVSFRWAHRTRFKADIPGSFTIESSKRFTAAAEYFAAQRALRLFVRGVVGAV